MSVKFTNSAVVCSANQKTLRAVDRVSLQLRAGEAPGDCRESGSGKTTLSRMMLGLLAPNVGRDLVRRRADAQQDRRALSRRVQAVFKILMRRLIRARHSPTSSRSRLSSTKSARRPSGVPALRKCLTWWGYRPG